MVRTVFYCAALICVLVVGYAIAQEVPPAAEPAAEPEAGAGDAAGPTVKVPAEKNPTLLELLKAGGYVMIPLFLCSVVMVMFSIERGLSLRRSKILPDEAVAKLKAATSLTEGKLDARSLMAEMRAQESPISRVAVAGLRRAGRSLPEIEKAIEDAGEKEADNMRRNCRVLAIVASISPLLGLLGTVLGMIKAFMTVAASEEALGRTGELASGIYEALVTTATGLTIAIPALVLYHIYVGRVDKLVGEMDELTIELVESMSAVPEAA
ncbi:MAG: MotA/TolQ/ExbB proton channel family protein [Planctomycetia bacterium]|nr:MotA/TolQ/ExbB proton channel family protein [Planctomycetia bacterium]